MNRRQFVTAASSAGTALGATVVAARLGQAAGMRSALASAEKSGETASADGARRVAFVIAAGFNVIDTAGPWEVFQDTMTTSAGPMEHPFELFTVAESAAPVRGTAGLTVVPGHTFESAPAPDVVVIPALGPSPALLDWVRQSARTADMVMSVCTGAFTLAATGLLDGLEATTHHDFYDRFAQRFPKVKLRRGLRYVEHEKLATAGGLTSGIDLALRVVERFHGPDAATATATYMEHVRAQQPVANK
jgi:transcriptional regulator GlxA family with amidase domain